ncbi:tyrosine-protein phosphatase non-receptor type substrate 1-like isoform X1 [Dryobates pubescens]|uniref:tyrosine-protein phosphatase non-receptor type substrate 1-like isoform X1 n=1 Tax=Dryobates pubescens TaxID=118200 RepID=UPI0023B936B1|nr:tyrosine-protein phosphatase non-receptor type substrate 1-like isoform X1 [Dryobates pubescens]
MEPPARGPRPLSWPLTCLLLLSLPSWPGVGAQSGTSRVQQPQEQLLAMAGQTITLSCTISGVGPPGPVEWLKGWGSENKTIYVQTSSSPRVTRVEGGSNEDFSIQIRDVQPEDAGTYYCVKFTRSGRPGAAPQVFQHGQGTVVSVQARPRQPVVSGPGRRAGTGASVSFTCETGGFFPKDISVRWLKNKAPISAQQPRVRPGHSNSSYTMSSTVTLALEPQDVRSQLACEVQHPTLPAPLRGTYQLREALRVAPSVRLLPKASSVELNKTWTLSCRVEGFYPRDLALSWLEGGRELPLQNTSRPVETPQGLFQLSSLVEVQATEDRNGSAFTCRVVHDGQDPISSTVTLWVAVPAKEGLGERSPAENGNLLIIYSVVGVVCTVLALLVAAVLYLIRTKQSKAGKSSPSARLHEPEKSSEATTQESDPNNLTYADLNFEKERKSIRRMVELSQQSEYASIQGSPAPGADDNLTYADLDMVHLNKAPKRPAPRPEEASSEYASVQIPRK